MTEEVPNEQNPQGTEGAPEGAPEGTEGERLFGGQFKSVEELEAAYAALQKPEDDKPSTNESLTAKKTDDSSENEDAENQESDDEQDKQDEEVSDALKAAGLDQDEFTKEFAETGELSEESFAKLEKAGFPRELSEVYVDGLKARRAAYEAEVLAPAGGREGYSQLLEWAGKNLSEADIDAFNEAVTSGNAARAKLAVSGLAAQAGMGGSKKPTLLNGKATGSGGPKPFASDAERRAAYNDPRYRSDPEYRKEVMARLSVTP